MDRDLLPWMIRPIALTPYTGQHANGQTELALLPRQCPITSLKISCLTVSLLLLNVSVSMWLFLSYAYKAWLVQYEQETRLSFNLAAYLE